MCVFIYYCFYTTYICKLFFANRPASLIPLHFHFLSLLKRLLPLPIKHSLKKKTKLRKNLKSNQQEEEKKNNFFNFWLQWCLFKSLYILRLAILLNLLLWFIIFNINDGDTLFLKITYYTTRTSLNRLNYIPSKTSMRYLMGHRCNCWSCHWNLFFGLSFFLEKKLEKSNEGWV